VCLEAVGDIRKDQKDLDAALNQYHASRAIFEGLRAKEPERKEWWREISHPLEEIADVLKEQGNLDDALIYYGRSFELRKRLSDEDPTSIGCECNLATSHRKIGDVRRALGDPDSALDEYRAALEILRRLVLLDPTYQRWAHDLALTVGGEAAAYVQKGNSQEALKPFLEAREHLLGIARDSIFMQRDLKMFDTAIARLSDRMNAQ
jgi:tetratricopeptide (TPR) repeat protein